jgi:hypothetical protein
MSQHDFMHEHVRSQDGGNVGLGTLAAPTGNSDASHEVVPNLSKEEIRSTIQANLQSVQSCFDDARRRASAQEGHLVVHFLIEPDGHVNHTALALNETGLSELPCCVTSAIKGWQFPAPKGGGVALITYPFAFKNPS